MGQFFINLYIKFTLQTILHSFIVSRWRGESCSERVSDAYEYSFICCHNALHMYTFSQMLFYVMLKQLLMVFAPLLLFYCRCLEAFCIYGSVGRVEEPYVSITRKKQMPRGGQSEEVERQVGQAEGKLFTHRAAFARTSVIQAFLGSAPQLTLQLYICVLQQGVSIGRGEGGGVHV